MYHDAQIAGVPLKSWDQLRASERMDFTPAKDTVESFNAYLRAAKILPGPVEDLHKAHMSLYLNYRFKYRNLTSSLPFYKRANAADRRYISITSNTFNARLRYFTAYPIPPTSEKYSQRDAMLAQKNMKKPASLGAVDRSVNSRQLYEIASAITNSTISSEMEDFFGNHVHDSMAGFIAMGGNVTNEFLINGLGIMRFREIFKENG